MIVITTMGIASRVFLVVSNGVSYLPPTSCPPVAERVVIIAVVRNTFVLSARAFALILVCVEFCCRGH